MGKMIRRGLGFTPNQNWSASRKVHYYIGAHHLFDI